MRSIIAPLLIFLLCPTSLLAQKNISGRIGESWDRVYSAERYIYGVEPVTFLKEQIGRLKKGKALCLAAGEGRNAAYLAQQGFEVLAVDISAKGLEKCAQLARERGVEVQTQVADLHDYDMGESQYDLITNFYYCNPPLFPKIIKALKPGGNFILQHFSIDQLTTNRFGPNKPHLLFGPNELLDHFALYRIRHYEDTVVDLDEGMHQGPGAVVRLIVEKTKVK